MFLRKTYLQSRLSLPDSGEHTTDIAMREPITNLWVEFRCRNGATKNQNVTMADCISAIEVIDGSEVLFSLDGYMALALTANYHNCLPNQLVTELANTYQNLSVWIPFGRFVGDPTFAFDPTRYINPQIRVKWNLAAVQAVGANGFKTGDLSLTIVANVMEGGSSPSHVLMIKEIYSYVTAAGIEYIDLPTDYPYKALLFRADLAATAIYATVNNLKLQVNQEQFIPFNMRMTDLIRYQSAVEPLLHMDHVFFACDADVLQFILRYCETPIFISGSQDDTVYWYSGLGRGEGAIHVDHAAAAEGADSIIVAHVSGYCIHDCVWVNFGRQDEPGDYFPAPDFRSVRLEATGAVAAGKAFVALVQARPY